MLEQLVRQSNYIHDFLKVTPTLKDKLQSIPIFSHSKRYKITQEETNIKYQLRNHIKYLKIFLILRC